MPNPPSPDDTSSSCCRRCASSLPSLPAAHLNSSRIQVYDTYVAVLAPLAPLLAEEIHHFAAGALADPAKGEAGSSVFEKVWVEAVRFPLLFLRDKE